ncbi:hypothetical protein CTI12_AA278740 [Artemisia annua]|uniref:Uncharacterized protein n=1 Tax=Artemisia annua TaxID=35608 RepID=A0A2U1NC73_ARTAN|nr:hypothetical protein CTI12_AA278740 [Artemisia annua]
MPVSTRSRVNVIQDQSDQENMKALGDQQQLRNPQHRLKEKMKAWDQQQLRNPQHGLKEKMKALTQLYEQQLRNPRHGLIWGPMVAVLVLEMVKKLLD